MKFNKENLQELKSKLMKLDKLKVLNERRKVINLLKKYNGKDKIKLSYSKEMLDKILFKSTKYRKCFAIDFELIKKLDLSDVCFDYVEIQGLDFTGSFGVKINPQNVPSTSIDLRRNDVYAIRDMTNCCFNGVTFTGSFCGCTIENSDFTGSKGAYIAPLTLLGKSSFKGFIGINDLLISPPSLEGCNLCDVSFYDDVLTVYDNKYLIINNTSFKGSKNAKIDPQKIYLGKLENCDFSDVTFTGRFNNCSIINSSFKGSKNALIHLQLLKSHPLCPKGVNAPEVNRCDFHDAIVFGDYYTSFGMSDEMIQVCEDEKKKVYGNTIVYDFESRRVR